LKLGAALYAGWVALVITGIVGGLGLAFQQPWLFPSLGPTIFVHTVTPNQEAARPWNTFVGHAIGVAAAFLSLALFGALNAPSAMVSGQVSFSRIAASALAVALTIGGQIPVRAGHAPAAATTLLITLGGFRADFPTVVVLVVGIGLATLPMRLGSPHRYVRVPPIAIGQQPISAKAQGGQGAADKLASGPAP